MYLGKMYLANASSPDITVDDTLKLLKMSSNSRLVLEGPLFEQYFEKVEVSNFEVASDAFSTFKARLSSSCCQHSQVASAIWRLRGNFMSCHLLQDLLTRHKGLVASFLSQNYDEVLTLSPCVSSSATMLLYVQ